MSTHYYNLPTVDSRIGMGFPDAVNSLAVATDATLENVRESFAQDPFKLNPATTEKLGGVRVGAGFKIFADGTLTTEQNRFKLNPATNAALGGVIAGRNININDAGAIGLGSGALTIDEIATQYFEAGAVTSDKIASNAIAESNIEPDLYNVITGIDRVWGNADVYQIDGSPGGGGNLYHGIDMYVINPKLIAFIPSKYQIGSSYIPDNFWNWRTETAPQKMYRHNNGHEIAGGELFTVNVDLSMRFYEIEQNKMKYRGVTVCSIDGYNGTFTRHYFKESEFVNTRNVIGVGNIVIVEQE